MNKINNMRYPSFLVVAAVTICLSGCVGRTGKVGTPIAARYSQQLNEIQVGKTTPLDIRRIFGEKVLSRKEAGIDNGVPKETWELARGGNMDAAAFLMWGQVAYDKDQAILFKFEDGKLFSYESVVLPDPPAKK